VEHMKDPPHAKWKGRRPLALNLNKDGRQTSHSYLLAEHEQTFQPESSANRKPFTLVHLKRLLATDTFSQEIPFGDAGPSLIQVCQLRETDIYQPDIITLKQLIINPFLRKQFTISSESP